MVDPYFNDVALLLHMDGSDGSTTFTDSSNSALTVTRHGNAQIDTAQSKFGGASGLFDGTGDYLTLPNAVVDLTGPFSVECWYRMNTDTGLQQTVFSNRQVNGSSNRGFIFGVNSSSKLFGVVYDGVVSPELDVFGSTTITTGQWYHLALTYDGTTYRGYLDGVEEFSATGGAGLNPTTEVLHIGTPANNTTTNYVNGWVDDVRITNGVARYTSNFTPPTAAFPDVFGDPNYDDVNLLLLMNGSDGSTTFTDSSSNGFTVTANGGAQIDTAQSKFGGASGLFNGSSHYLSIADDNNLSLSPSGWTVEAWVRLDDLSTGKFNPLFSKGQSNFSREYVFDIRNNAGTIEARYGLYSDGNAFTLGAASTLTISTGTWYHVAWSHDGTDLRFFLDGVQQGSATTCTPNPGNRTQPAYVGRFLIPAVFNRYLDGWIDDFRFTNGAARYTSNFTPPTEELPTSGGATAYTIDLAAGSYSLSGSELTFVTSAATYTIDLDAGSYTVSGSDVGLAAGRVISIEAETFTLAGANLNLVKTIPIELGAGSFTLTGADVTLARGATIVSQPTDVTVNQPNDAVFNVLAIHPQGRELTYQWYEDGVALTGETGTTLTISSPVGSESGNEYYVIVTDTSDGSTVQSNTATLTVNGSILEPAVICPKRSYTAGAEPGTDDIIEGEVAINITDGKLWIRDGGNNIVLLGGLQDNWGLPTSDPAVAGEFWNDSGTLKVSNG